MDAGYTEEGKGAGWAEKVLGWMAVMASYPPKVTPEEIDEEVSEGVGRRERVDPEELSGPWRFGDLPRRSAVGDRVDFSWLSQNRRFSKDY